MSLLETQRQFCAFLRDAASDMELRAANDGATGLAVYHHAYRAQLIACLRETYTKTWAWLGDDAFDAAARSHVAAHPPKSWTLSVYGADFPDLLAELYPEDPEVAEIARLDWTLRQVFDGPDGQAIGLADLAEVDWDTARLRFVPTLSVFPVVTNAPALWNAMAAEDAPPSVHALPAPAAVRVWRAGLSPQFRTMEAEEAEALALARNGESFAGLCAALAQTLGEAEAAAKAAGFLALWIQDELISALD